LADSLHRIQTDARRAAPSYEIGPTNRTEIRRDLAAHSLESTAFASALLVHSQHIPVWAARSFPLVPPSCGGDGGGRHHRCLEHRMSVTILTVLLWYSTPAKTGCRKLGAEREQRSAVVLLDLCTNISISEIGNDLIILSQL
jgi:hypothetical protein